MIVRCASPSHHAAKKQALSVAGYPCPDTALPAEPIHLGFHDLSARANDWGAAVGEDSASDVRPCAPAKLTDDGGMPHQRATFLAHHRTTHGCAVADIEVDCAKSVGWSWQLGNIRQIKEAASVR